MSDPISMSLQSPWLDFDTRKSHPLLIFALPANLGVRCSIEPFADGNGVDVRVVESEDRPAVGCSLAACENSRPFLAPTNDATSHRALGKNRAFKSFDKLSGDRAEHELHQMRLSAPALIPAPIAIEQPADEVPNQGRVEIWPLQLRPLVFIQPELGAEQLVETLAANDEPLAPFSLINPRSPTDDLLRFEKNVFVVVVSCDGADAAPRIDTAIGEEKTQHPRSLGVKLSPRRVVSPRVDRRCFFPVAQNPGLESLVPSRALTAADRNADCSNPHATAIEIEDCLPRVLRKQHSHDQKCTSL